MGRFNDIDLSALEPPDAVEALDYEAILATRKADMAERVKDILPDWNPDLESDTTVKHLEESSYREGNIRQRINDVARAVLLPTATGADLDAIAARYHVARQVIDPGDADAVPPVEPTYESDASLRERTLLAFEALSVAGPKGAYIAAAKNADARVKDVSVTSPAPGEVLVTVLSTEGDGVAGVDLLNTAAEALSDEDVRPLTDHVTVQAGTRIDYKVSAQLSLYDGPDSEVVLEASEASCAAFVEGQRKLGEPVTIDGLHKALRVDGVKKVNLISPAADVEPAATEFAHCTAIAVTVAGES